MPGMSGWLAGLEKHGTGELMGGEGRFSFELTL